jgi:hypothetical protein
VEITVRACIPRIRQHLRQAGLWKVGGKKSRVNTVIVVGEAIHPGGAVDGGLTGSDERRLRKIERVAAGGVAAGCGNRTGDMDAFAVIPGVDERNVSAMVAPYSAGILLAFLKLVQWRRFQPAPQVVSGFGI